jgi:cyclopropane fatty-acyl-phospholipid synthase-like methyltransferase
VNRPRFSAIAHAEHVFANPLGEGKVDRVLGYLDLAPSDRVLDVGCGKGEFLLRLIERYGVFGVGVDPSPWVIDEAHRRAAGRVEPSRLTLHRASIAEVPVEPGSFAAALSIGSSHAYGDYRQTVPALAAAVRPGGHVLLGEGYWKRTPDPAYLEFLSASPDELTDHAGNIAAGLEVGLTYLYAAVSSEDDWDHYEGLYVRSMERWLAAHPEDPDHDVFREAIHQWRDGYLRWGRDTLGFAIYLFRK